MHQVAVAMERLATARGARFRYGAEVSRIEATGGRVSGVVLADGGWRMADGGWRMADGERIPAHAVVANADLAALADGRFGAAAQHAVPKPSPDRSLSAMNWCLDAATEGFPLSRHTVFFSPDYEAEVRDIFDRGRLPESPTVYVCAQDRDDIGTPPTGPERLMVLTNAPSLPRRSRHARERASACWNAAACECIAGRKRPR